MQEKSTRISPELTPLYIGPGVKISGRIEMLGSSDNRAVVLGSFEGSMHCDGVVQIPPGGHMLVDNLKCKELVLGGSIRGIGANSTIIAEAILLGPMATIAAGEIRVPPGGLEQARGAVINGRLNMTAEQETNDDRSGT